MVIDDLRAGNRAAVPDGCPHSSHGSYRGHVRAGQAFALGPFDAVVHLAAEAEIEASVTDPAVYFQANLSDSLVLLDAMRAQGVSPVDPLVDRGHLRGAPGGTIDESHPQEPINAYGESKLMLERCLRWYHKRLRAEGGRVPVLQRGRCDRGPRRGAAARDPSAAPRAGCRGRPARRRAGVRDRLPTPDGTCIRDYVHVVDIARAHLLALDRIDDIGLDFFNVGSETGYLRQASDRFGESMVVGRRVPWRPAGRRPGDPAVLVASAGRLKERLGWAPDRPGLEPIVESAWRWRERHPHGYAE